MIRGAAAAKGEIVLGLIRRDQPGLGLMLNPDRDVELHLRPEAAVVLLSTVAVPPGLENNWTETQTIPGLF
jgi:hypothetical protein